MTIKRFQQLTLLSFFLVWGMMIGIAAYHPNEQSETRSLKIGEMEKSSDDRENCTEEEKKDAWEFVHI